MHFIHNVASKAIGVAGAMRVASVYIGVSYTAAVLENGNCGMAFVFKDELVAGCNVPLPKRPLAGSTVAELANFAGHSSIANSIALAVANAVLNPMNEYDMSGDLLEHFRCEPGMKLGMVGHFRPLVPFITKTGAELFVFDQHPDPFSGIYSPDKIPELLPTCDAAIITGTSIINQTFDEILRHVTCDKVAVLGSSTPMHPACYEKTPVSCTAGVIIRDVKGVIHAVVEAGGQKVFNNHVEKVNFFL